MPRYRVDVDGGCLEGHRLWVDATSEVDALAQALAALQERGRTPLAGERHDEEEGERGHTGRSWPNLCARVAAHR